MKKIISTVLSIIMILAMMPVCTGIAFAEEGLPLIAPNPVSVGEFYNVYLYSDGELLTMTSALDGTQVTPPAKDPQKDDYKFAGWYADETLKTKFDFSQPITGDTNIYAKWKKLSSKSIKSGLEKTSITAKSKLAKSSSGKDGIKITWEKVKGYKIDYYQIQRATSRDGKYETVYITKSGNATSYVNTKNLKNGKKYYYRVRGVRTVNGKKVYTKWGKCYRTFKKLLPENREEMVQYAVSMDYTWLDFFIENDNVSISGNEPVPVERCALINSSGTYTVELDYFPQDGFEVRVVSGITLDSQTQEWTDRHSAASEKYINCASAVEVMKIIDKYK